MLKAYSYKINGIEYMVVEDNDRLARNAVAVQLLADYREGVGAGCVIYNAANSEAEVYLANGERTELAAEIYQAILSSVADYEVHLTDYFVDKLNKIGLAELNVAC